MYEITYKRESKETTRGENDEDEAQKEQQRRQRYGSPINDCSENRIEKVK